MSFAKLVRAELRKLTTRMPWAFLAVLIAIAAINASAVIWGTDFDGSKGFISTAGDQRSPIAFAANALSGVTPEAAGVESQVSAGAAVFGLPVWALVPAVVGLVSVQRRDVV